MSAAFLARGEFGKPGSAAFIGCTRSVGRQLTYSEFATDRQQVLGGADLEASKTAYAAAFVNRSEFVQRFAGKTTAETFVDALLQTARTAMGVDLMSERANLIIRYNASGSAGDGRAAVLRELGENQTLARAVYNPSFVAMEYFGYLRRGAEPEGYAFWLNVLNGSSARIIAACLLVLTSAEYQGTLATSLRTNAECSGQNNSAQAVTLKPWKRLSQTAAVSYQHSLAPHKRNNILDSAHAPTISIIYYHPQFLNHDNLKKSNSLRDANFHSYFLQAEASTPRSNTIAI